MISEYLILISLIIVSVYFTILTVITLYLNKQKTLEKKQYQKLKNKVGTYLKVFFFFLISIIITRLVFSFQYPQQFHDLGISISIGSWAFYFIILQICAVFIYSLFSLFFILFLKLVPDSRISYLLKVLKYNLLFCMMDLLVSGLLYLKINFELVFTNLDVGHSNPEPGSYMLVLLAGAGIIANSVLFYFVERKGNRNTQNWFFGAVTATLYISIPLGFANLYYIVQSQGALQLFTFHEAFYAWLWLGLIFITLGSQTAVGILYGYKTKFINRFFAANYIKQLNRISLISILGVSVVAILPQIYLIIFNG